jgi:hypothetical protein
VELEALQAMELEERVVREEPEVEGEAVGCMSAI